jgi:hypothetical protein
VGGFCELAPKAEVGDACVSDRQCTTGKCQGGLCARKCGLPLQRCHPYYEPCCGGGCGPENSLSQTCAAVPSCFPLYAPCASAADCCSKVCTGGLCRHAGACSPDAAACVGNDECCSALCARGYKGPIKCVACLATGYNCTRSADCCSKLCDAGVCKTTAKPCERINGAVCNNAGECCSGKCEPIGNGMFKECMEP